MRRPARRGFDESGQRGAAKPEGKKFKIAGIIMQDDEFFRMVDFGMTDAATKAGVELVHGNSNGKPDKEAELINTYVAQGVDAIIISPISKTQSVQMLKAASDKGIKIVCQNNPLDADFPVAAIESDQVDLGTQTGKEAVKYIQEKMEAKPTSRSWRSRRRFASRATRESAGSKPKSKSCLE